MYWNQLWKLYISLLSNLFRGPGHIMTLHSSFLYFSEHYSYWPSSQKQTKSGEDILFWYKGTWHGKQNKRTDIQPLSNVHVFLFNFKGVPLPKPPQISLWTSVFFPIALLYRASFPKISLISHKHSTAFETLYWMYSIMMENDRQKTGDKAKIHMSWSPF